AAQIANVPETTNVLTVATSSLPATTAGVANSLQLTTTGGVPSTTWTLTGGALPVGMSLSTSGLLSGSATQPGSYGFSVQAQDSCEVTAAGSVSLVVNRAPSIDAASLPGWTVGFDYSKSLV